jgi:hypothetical protein
MSQHNWIYKNENGPDYEIGLYHGDKSGHVMIYVGQQIIKIDFSVFTEKKYHFQLGTELVALVINYGEKGKCKLLSEKNGKEIPFLPKEDYPNKYMVGTALVFFIILIIVFTKYFFQ